MDGSVKVFIPDPDQESKEGSVGAESVTADAHGNLYAGEVDRKEVKKFVKQ